MTEPSGEASESEATDWPEAVVRKLAVLPESPGVYKMLGRDGEILYIGKAKVLRNRVRSYFQSQKGMREITRLLVARIRDLDWVVTGTEKEALLLENSLIKEHLPHFNISLKDNKTYPYIKISHDGVGPRAFKTRELAKDGVYYGPYTDVSLLYAYLDVIHELFPLKKCGQRSFPRNHQPCLYFHIGKCLDYCTGGVTPERKKELLDEVGRFLGGKTEDAVALLRGKMEFESKTQNFERALEIRDRMEALTRIRERQQVVLSKREAFDAVSYHSTSENLVFAVLSFRGGILLDKTTWQFDVPFLDDPFEELEETARDFLLDTVEQFLFQYYAEKPWPVEEILLPFAWSRGGGFSDSLGEVIRRRFEGDLPEGWTSPVLRHGASGEPKRLLDLAGTNARLSFFELQRAREREGHAAVLKDLLRLPRIPRTIECFDIAHTGSTAIMAGMVHFENGQPEKSRYRLFHIRSTKDPNDFASMQEAVYRRYRRLLEERKDLPDLILIDGGRPQLQAASEALASLGVKGQPLLALAKEEERIYVPKQAEPLKIPPDNAGLLFLIRVRDETHRFINGSHGRKRDQLALRSRLEDVPGIGPAKLKILQDRYPGLDALLAASDDEIASLPRMTREDVKKIRRTLGEDAASGP